MSILLLILDFLCPAFFLFLGRKLGGKRGRVMVGESLGIILLALVFSPIAYLFFSLAVQGVLCAFILFVHFLLLAAAEWEQSGTK